MHMTMNGAGRFGAGVVSCPENSNINSDGLDSVVIGSRVQ